MVLCSSRGQLPVLLGIALAGCSPLRSLSIAAQVDAAPERPQEQVVRVELWKRNQCFVAPPGTRVWLDGEPLTLVSAGRTLSKITRGPEFSLNIPNCEPCLCQSRPLTRRPPGRARVEVEMGRSRGLLEVDGLLAQRTARLVSPGPLRPGQRVDVQWLPATDVWPSEIFDAEVRLQRQGQQPVTVKEPGLQVKGGLFSFTMPDLPAGALLMSLRPGARGPWSRVARCRGFGECRGGDVGWPKPLPAVVGAR